MSGVSPLSEIATALESVGIFMRGVVRFDEGEGPELEDGDAARSVVLLGNVGGSIWPAFALWRENYTGPDPLDTWSKAMIGPLARKLSATAYFPSDPPYQPFQRWALQAEDLKPSPLGILLHPRYGLWHGYRGALGFSFAVDCPPAEMEPVTELGSWDEACVTACPVAAVTSAGFDVAKCRAYLQSEAGQATCMVSGCASRNACPIGAEFRYPPDQLRFHMRALF
ncbi:4Fe-4S dicluster domain-containing protein [Neorhizobium sp. T786]|uniref:4Fe-4S dicluster domain-containing protein n=1 Tax=Pseudorhizobium xiangyangii TaxID=2883104 RepID=UPI001CFF7C51|nr:4Fe-4S dicluster domain-containing protein [Neorhizobium xiangyangii]MCB5201005.1 4Fe-4S dicluster domain-containing protein [Neorhizobium xiangyangii]